MNPTSHRHGGEWAEKLAALGLSREGLLDFSLNLSPLGPPPVLAQAWDSWFPLVEPYPEKTGAALGQYYQTRFALDPQRVLPLNGSIEGIYLWPQALGLRRVLLPLPSFFDYQAALALAQVEVTPWRLDPKNHFSFAGLEAALQGQEAVIFGSPHNPTGQAIKAPELLGMVERNPQVRFLVDQAFLGLADDPKGLSLLEFERPNLWVLHSLTKEFALAGLRLGALVGPREGIGALASRLPPWRINGLALAAAKLLPQAQEYLREVQTLLAQERTRIYQALQGHLGLTLTPTSSNFFLARLGPGRELDPFLEAALRRGLALRDCRNFAGLEGPYFRFAVKKPAENQALLEFLHEFA